MSSRKPQSTSKDTGAVASLAMNSDSSGRIAQRLFESKVLTIAVGKAKVVLNVYEEALKKTAFFRVEGSPTTDTEKESRLKETLRGSTSDKPVEIDTEDNKRGIKRESKRFLSATSGTLSDYYLHEQDTKILQLEPFKKFLLFLHDLSPTAILSKSEVRVMLQAYCIARRYECTNIQNEIIDLLCVYHTGTQVDFDGLLWMITWGGDNTECPLTAYLITQVAFDIASIGFKFFERRNKSITRFIETGDSHIRLKLFEAISRHAGNTDSTDPATTSLLWHVRTDLVPQGKHEFESVDDVIILD